MERNGLLKLVIAGMVLVCLAAPVLAIDPLRLMSQYLRERWGSDRGFLGGTVSAFAQTDDGYLWIGTEKGLTRFDGLNFRVVQQATPASLPIGPVEGLQKDAQGNLWILLQNTNVLRYRDGQFELGRDEAESGITAISKQRDGTVLFSSLAFGALTYDKGRFEILPLASGGASNAAASAKAALTDDRSSHLSWASSVASHRLAEPNSAVVSMTETEDGKVWLGTRDRGLFYVSEGRVSAVGSGLPKGKVTCLLPLENGKLWIGTENGVVAWDGTSLSKAGVPSSLRNIKALAMIRDHDANIWVGSTDGLYRVSGGKVSFDAGRGESGAATALFEDREGNMWVGGTNGIERLRDSAFLTYSVAAGQAQSSGPVYVDADGRAWYAPFEGGLHWLKDDKRGSVTNDQLGQDVVYSITGDKNELWLGRQRGGLTNLRYTAASVTAKTYTQADGLAQNGVYAVYRGHDGSVWAATLSGGVSQYKDGHFTTYTTANGLASNTIVSIAEGADGTMWFATPNGLSALSNGQWRMFTVRDGLPSDNVNCLLSDSRGVLWIGTAQGLGVFRAGKAQTSVPTSAPFREQVFGIAEDKNGRLWIATSNHVLASMRQSLLSGTLAPADVRDYGFEDGLLGTEGVKRHQSVFADAFGRAWFSMNRGLSVVDTTRAIGNSAPVIVQIESLSTDGNANDLQQPVRIPAGGHKITFGYSGLSLSVPERVRFKFKLDGFDKGWSEPVTSREAVYTNLGSGTYRFRLVAGKGDGLWNSSESSVWFTVSPVFWKTWWFQLSSGAAIAVFIVAYIRFRMLTLTKQLNVRFEERLAERTRIAQELHDTLLQGFLSASMQLHVANDHLPANSHAKPFVVRALELMGQVTEESRNAVRGLRTSKAGSADLQQAFSEVRKEFPVQSQIEFRVIVEGGPRALHPLVSEEIYLIGHEALSNAFRHSRAREIEVELEYAASYLRVIIRDDGEGIDPEVLRSGREGHWGLSGMKERTQRIGGRLRVLSRAVAGTEVELSVPAKIAFESRREDRRVSWLSGRFSRKRQNESPQSESGQVS